MKVLFKVVESVLYLLNELVYFVFYVVLVAYKKMIEYRYIIGFIVLMICIVWGGIFGYCWRMTQIYGM